MQTDTPAPTSTDAATRPPKKPIYFHALVHVHGDVRRDGDAAVFEAGGTAWPLELSEASAAVLKAGSLPEGQVYRAAIWPRTDDTGRLSAGAVLGQLVAVPPCQDPPHFTAAGRLQGIRSDEGFFTLGIEPNGGPGLLKETFTLIVWASLEVLETLPKVGRTVGVKGEWRPRSGRLIASKVSPIWIGPRPEKPEKKRKPAP